jgi:hypothetical protein
VRARAVTLGAPSRPGTSLLEKYSVPHCTSGLRIVDVADLLAPREIGYFIPEPVADCLRPRSNDVDVADRGLIYLANRIVCADVLELCR